MDAPKSKRKRLAWNEQSEAAILELWAERVEELRTERRNSHIYGEMANDLAKLGYNYSGRDVQVKLANFTQRYRKETIPSPWPFYERVHHIIGDFKPNTFFKLTLDSMDETAISSNPTPHATKSSPLSSPLLTPLHSTPSSQQGSPPPPSVSPRAVSPRALSPTSPTPNRSTASLPKKKKKNCMSNFQVKILQKFEMLSSEITRHLKNSSDYDKEILKIEQQKADSLKQIATVNEELKNIISVFLKNDS
uniref:Myb/SANT-like DNA-binding domain-containing protein 1 n=2 Tax=Ceratitis capitata TaxID=7213 RepID=W8CCJ1_CERCA